VGTWARRSQQWLQSPQYVAVSLSFLAHHDTVSQVAQRRVKAKPPSWSMDRAAHIEFIFSAE
jgi:hypothetical protein